MKSDMSAVFGRRLQQARAMRGMSLRSLSELLKNAVSHTALAKYEAGSMMPGSETVIRLAEALSQSVDFFFRPFAVELKELRFRRKSYLGARQRLAIKEKAADFFERYHEAEQIVGDVRTFDPVFGADRAISSPEEVEDLADELRRRWALGCDAIPNVSELLAEKGIKVFELPRDQKDFDGLSADSDFGPVMVLASYLNGNLPRKRMTETHELGHIVIPVRDGLDEAREEAIVGRFAGAFLMPRSTFESMFGSKRTTISLGELIALKASLGASIMAIMKRAHQLQLIDDRSYRQFCRFVSRSGWRSAGTEPGDDKWRGSECNARFGQLVLRAVAEERISATKGAALLNESLEAFRKRFQEVVA